MSQSPSQHAISLPKGKPLPPYGFGSTINFEELVDANPFLFRVYTPKRSSASSEHFFVGHSYEDDATANAIPLASTHSDRRRSCASDMSYASTTSYADVARHLDWTSRSTSPYISTSFSFSWAIWEACRRYWNNVKHDVHIAVIDARAVEGRAVTALELLRNSSPQERHAAYWTWYQFALEAQDVLVYGFIPHSAVYTSIPLLNLLPKLPSYFLHSPSAEPWKQSANPFDALAWDCAERKPSYRLFCQDMSERFLRLPPHLRLRDATGGAVRLALEFLRPWFRKECQSTHDAPLATSTVCSLAYSIAQWPGQWWAQDHTELWDLIGAMVQQAQDEHAHYSREEQGRGDGEKDKEEARRLQGVVEDLERLVQDHEARLSASSLGSRPASPREGRLLLMPPPADSKQEESEEEPVYESDSDPAEEALPRPSDFAYSYPTSVRPHSMAETASCIVTGFLFGAFITMCTMTSQRRTLIMGLT